MFTLLEATGAKTLTDLHKGGPKTLITMIKAFCDLTEEEQETASYLWDKLFVGKTASGRPDEKGKDTPPASVEKKRRNTRKGRIRVSLFPLFRP